MLINYHNSRCGRLVVWTRCNTSLCICLLFLLSTFKLNLSLIFPNCDIPSVFEFNIKYDQLCKLQLSHFLRVWWSLKTSNVNSNQWLLWLNKKFKNCHISTVIAKCLWCSQFTSHLNKCKFQSSTFSIGNPLIQVAIVSLQVQLITVLFGWFPKALSCWLMLQWCIWCIWYIFQWSTTFTQWSCKLAVFFPVFWKIFRFWKI